MTTEPGRHSALEQIVASARKWEATFSNAVDANRNTAPAVS
jgi:hypothetical protein